jgi:hypothetical protein
MTLDDVRESFLMLFSFSAGQRMLKTYSTLFVLASMDDGPVSDIVKHNVVFFFLYFL